MELEEKIYLAGHKGLVGSAIFRLLRGKGYKQIITKEREELDLKNDKEVKKFFEKEKPEFVFLAAAKVGGILANRDYPGEFIYDNLKIQNNVIHQAFKNNVKKLLFLGSSCIYPKFSPQPMKEEHLLTGPLEPTNEAYAIAKIAGIKMCQAYNQQYKTNFISVMPTNLYGPNDNFNLKNSHVLPALIRKMHEAKREKRKEVEIWGTGKPKREFLFVEDLAEACEFLMKNYNENEIINVGTGEDISICRLAKKIRSIVGFKGDLFFNTKYPDGTPRKLLDNSKIKKLGWEPKNDLEKGIKKTYKWYLSNKN